MLDRRIIMASAGSGLRITDVPYSNVPDITSKVFINDAGKLRQTDLDTMVRYSSIYQTVVTAGEEGVANVQATIDAGHEKLLQDISAVDDLRTAVADINVRLDNLSTAAKDITLESVSGLSATNAQDAIAELQSSVSSCFQSVSDGKSAVATALTNQGVATSATATYTTMAANVGVVANNKYNAGIAYADGRTNTSSVNYKNGYNAGVTAADARVNTASASYQQGVTDGGAGKIAVSTQSRTITITIGGGSFAETGVMPYQSASVTFSFPHGVLGVYNLKIYRNASDVEWTRWAGTSNFEVSGNTVSFRISNPTTSEWTTQVIVYAYGY